jgi:hypothetical protein
MPSKCSGFSTVLCSPSVHVFDDAFLYKLYFLLEQKDRLMNIHQWQIPPKVVMGLENRSIGEISDKNVKR